MRVPPLTGTRMTFALCINNANRQCLRFSDAHAVGEFGGGTFCSSQPKCYGDKRDSEPLMTQFGAITRGRTALREGET